MTTPAINLRFSATTRVDYPVVVDPGLTRRIPDLLADQLSWSQRDVVVIADDRVVELHGAELEKTFNDDGRFAIRFQTFRNGEPAKNLSVCADLFDRLIDTEVHRRALVVNFGGGVACDLGGFIAATYLRGIPYVNIPTTLMAQIDAAIGGKVAVNHRRGKNLLGSFYSPLGVLVDPVYLRTLPDDEIRNGVAEIIKVAIIHSPTLFSLLESSTCATFTRPSDVATLLHIMELAIGSKLRLLQPDPYESDLRRPLNFGHTFGHPIEAASEYRIKHGYAVAIGMTLATEVSLARGLLDQHTADRIIHLISRFGLPTAGPDFDPEWLWHHYVDIIRRVRAQKLHFVLPSGIGTVEIVDDIEQSEFVAAYQRTRQTYTPISLDDVVCNWA